MSSVVIKEVDCVGNKEGNNMGDYDGNQVGDFVVTVENFSRYFCW